MKFLINSKYMHAKIAEAIGKESISWSARSGELIFIGEGGTTEMLIEARVHQSHECEEFLPAYWRDVVRFLKTLPEQPLVVDLDYNQVDITAVSQFKISGTE